MKFYSSTAEITPESPEHGNACVGSVSRASSGSVSRHSRAAFAMLFLTTVTAWEETCAPFKEVYTGGEDLCNRIFGDSFVYEADEDKAYTMWWFEAGSPNEEAARNLGLTVPDTCELEYWHKEKPSPEGEDFTECGPWKDKACCHNSTVMTADQLRAGYGEGYEWDRCGPMSPMCERFFVQEACMYECDVTAGLYRKCSDAEAEDPENKDCFENKWQIQGMPIKASYCDAWFNACRNDYFCKGGDFFSCNALYWENQETAEAARLAAEAARLAELDKSKRSVGLLIGVVVAVVMVLGGALFYIIRREKRGDPIFVGLVHADEQPDDVNNGEA